MKTILLSMLVVRLMSSEIGMSYAADSMADREASPTSKERLTKDTIEGTLMFIIGEHYYIKDDEGIEKKIHVDKSTKLDTVKVGDLVKAYVTKRGHTTTLQRVK